MTYRILFNPLAGKYDEDLFESYLPLPFEEKIQKYDITKVDNFDELLASFEAEDKIVVCGGDGTLNNFINSVNTDSVENDILFFAMGSGNDFLNDLGIQNHQQFIKINDYIKNLPVLSANEKSYKFINGIGFGVDGYVCKEVNRIRRQNTRRKKSYTLIALKGLLFMFKPVNATVIADGKEYKFKKVWMVPTMKGKFFGGGMMIAPNQDRKNSDNTLSVIIAHDLSTLKIATLFPSIFKGKHIKYTDYVTVLTANNITVKFDRICDMQIDGETLTDVKEYTVTAKAKALV